MVDLFMCVLFSIFKLSFIPQNMFNAVISQHQLWARLHLNKISEYIATKGPIPTVITGNHRKRKLIPLVLVFPLSE